MDSQLDIHRLARAASYALVGGSHVKPKSIDYAAVKAVLASIKAQGFSIVPDIPTADMIDAGDEVMSGRYGCCFEVRPIYRAMVDAYSPSLHKGGE